MPRFGTIFVVLCMVLIAASLGAVLYLMFGLSGTESATVAIFTLAALAVYNTFTVRLQVRPDLSGQIADLSRAAADLARQMAEFGRRLAALEARGEQFANTAAEKARIATDPLAAELGELGALVKQLADTVATHQLSLDGIKGQSGPQEPPPAQGGAAPAESGIPVAATADTSAVVDGADEMIQLVRGAIEAGRVDLYLQPIVTLPQRKVRYYEAFTRLRTENGKLVEPPEFLEAAEAGGLMPRIDNLLLLRSVQVVRRLQLKNRDIGLFCNLAASTLNDPELFPQILQFMDANRALAPSLVLELKQQVLRAMGPLEVESLVALRDIGFRFCIDQVTDLRMEPRDLGERGIRYVKVPAPLLLDQASAPSSDIHAADLSDLLGRFGISLIAERIETEAQVVDLLEYDVRFGQGFLFSPPRPVRAEALRGTGEATDATSHDAAARARDKVVSGGPAGLVL
jgi:cyclic-di-GMP phosphodiesterase TipF (flagellum assembly factor)